MAVSAQEIGSITIPKLSDTAEMRVQQICANQTLWIIRFANDLRLAGMAENISYAAGVQAGNDCISDVKKAYDAVKYAVTYPGECSIPLGITDIRQLSDEACDTARQITVRLVTRGRKRPRDLAPGFGGSSAIEQRLGRVL